MNTFYKLFIIKKEADSSILLYGYALPDSNNEREWSRGVINKRLGLYRLTCVMNENQSQEFQNGLVSEDEIVIKGEFHLREKYIRRPNTIFYPKEDPSVKNESLIKKLSVTKEYWNLNKDHLFHELQKIYRGNGPSKQRENINEVIRLLSEETAICFLNNAADRIGNIEVYIPNKEQESFQWCVSKSVDEKNKNTTAKGIRVIKKGKINYDVLVNCSLYNADRCLINVVKEMKSSDDEIEFSGGEVISEVEINIWNKETGELIYRNHSNIVRQIILSTCVDNKTKYLINDDWSKKLERTFGGSIKKEGKLNQIKSVERQSKAMVSKIGDFSDDPWNESGQLADKLIRTYRIESSKGAFCKKVDEGECEIDSFQKIIHFINEPGVRKVIIVDPYFSVISMKKFFTRITNLGVRVEIITSLSNIDPDKEGSEATDHEYIDKVRKFLTDNYQIIHQYLRIINVTKNGKTVIHDRYLVRLLEDGTIDGYLLSNSLNSAGQNYSFVIAPMEKEVTYQVLEYINELKDDHIQRKKSKKERLDIESLWDTFEEKIQKSVTNSIPVKEWEDEMKKSYGNDETLELSSLFNKGWEEKEELGKEGILKLSWYLYHSNQYTALQCVEWLIHNKINMSYFLKLSKEIITELEKEEENYEENDINKRSSERYAIRIALSTRRQEQVKINSKYFMSNFPSIYYGVNGYLWSLYQIIYCIDKRQIVSIMQDNKSPMAVDVILHQMVFNSEFEYEIYSEMNCSEIEWIKQWSYYYFSWYLLRKVRKGEVLSKSILHYLSDNESVSIFQYACCIEEIAFEIDSLRRRNNCKLDEISILVKELDNYIAKEVEVLEKAKDLDYNKLFGLLDGPNEALNCKNYLRIIETIKREEVKRELLNRIIQLLKEKWEHDQRFSKYTDYVVTRIAAYASLSYWNNDIEEVIKALNINCKCLFCACEPGKYDTNYKEWSNAVQKVLWQLLFLKNYKELLEYNNLEKENSYAIVVEKMDELLVIKEQIDKWNDNVDLIPSVFNKDN